MKRLAVLLWVGVLAHGAPARAQDCLDTATPDCDGDGFEPPDDCDDTDANVNPDAVEVCNNGTDDDCDSVVDDDCYDAFQTGTLEGGSTCEGNQNGWAVLGIVPPFLARRRRR